MALLHVNFFSEVLGLSCSMDVILPELARGQIGMPGAGRTDDVPVLYLLHGMSDDHTIWQRRTSIERYAAPIGLAVVMPTTHLGWYTDTCYGLDYFTFIADELPEICHSLFPQLTRERDRTFAAGLSMGGYGAFKLALARPERFGRAASLSGALDIIGQMRYAAASSDEGLHVGKPREFWTAAFGEPGEPGFEDNDLLVLAERARSICSDAGIAFPELWAWCGTEDGLLDQNRRVTTALSDMGYSVDYHESEGAHTWDRWDAQIRPALEFLTGEPAGL